MKDTDIAEVRRFNRVHTNLVGALNEGTLASDYSLAQVRILYEIAHAPKDQPPSARELGKTLRMDTGYISRIVSGLEDEGLITRMSSPGNAKRLALSLTAKGGEVLSKLDAASNEEVKALLTPLTAVERRELVGAMARIRRLLGDCSADRMFVLRDPAPGDLGWITYQHGRLYAEEYGWDWTFEALVAEIVGQFVKNFDSSKDRCWVAEREGQVVGSVFVTKQDDETAKLRLLYVDASARGLGLGKRLVDECIRFAQAKGYKRMILWTNDVLVSARRIYQAAGFELLKEERHHSFGKDLVGQIWGRDL